MAGLSGVQILQNELEKSRDKLKEFNENIKKLTGHENPRARRGFENQDYDESFSGRMGRGRGRLFGIAKRGLMEDSGPPVKRRVVGGAFARLGPAPVQRRVREDSPEDEDRPQRLSVHSSVVATSREAKNRQEIMKEQTKDKEGMQRNRRMFGLLMGTLSKFKTDSKTMESKEEQRKRIDQKLEENAEKEKKKFKQDTKQLMEERHLEETRISRLEQKMEVVQEHAKREQEMKKMKNFLCTKTKPRIFWKPRQMNTAAENKLKDSIKVVDEMLRKSQERLEKEIKDVMEREQKREERIKMRLREDGLFLDGENKEGEKDARDKLSKGKVDDDGDRVKLLGKSGNSDEEIEGRALDKKMKVKRRVVVEERSHDDDGSASDDSDKEEESEGEIEMSKGLKKGNREKDDTKTKKEYLRREDEDSKDETGSDSDSDSDDDNKNQSKKGKKGKKSRSDDEKSVDGDENSRVVLYRQSSKEKERSGKDKKKDGSDDKSERRHSKHSRRDHEQVDIKIETEDKNEKRKSKSSERIVVEDEEISSRNPMSLIGEEDDVEMESENNITM